MDDNYRIHSANDLIVSWSMLHSLENAIPKEWKEVLVHESIDYKEDNYETLYNKFTHLSNVFRITYGMLIQGTANIKIYGRR